MTTKYKRTEHLTYQEGSVPIDRVVESSLNGAFDGRQAKLEDIVAFLATRLPERDQDELAEMLDHVRA